MSRSRLQKPQGQQRPETPEGLGIRKMEERSFASPFHTTDPARFLFECFAESKGHRDPQAPSGKMKKWEELSIHDRRAWADVNRHMISASGHISIRLPPEDGETVAIVRRRGNVFAVEEVSLERLVKIADVRKVLAILDEELRRLSKEYAEAEIKKWRINEPKKFEAPR